MRSGHAIYRSATRVQSQVLSLCWHLETTSLQLRDRDGLCTLPFFNTVLAI